MAKNYFTKIISLFIGMLFITTILQAQIYVNSAATGANDGTSWVEAFTDLQTALAAVDSPVEIWVATGTYYPDEGTGQNNDDRNSTFQLINGVAIYGGFTGTETILSQRNWETNPAILSGDINKSGNLTGNSYTVVTGSGTNATALIDGFIITMGNSDFTTGSGISPNRSGGGMYNLNGSPTVTNCTFSGNWAVRGGGMFNYTNASPSVNNCNFWGNSAVDGGGMLNLFFSSPMVTYCNFSENMTILDGGGMFNWGNCSPTISNCTFSGNSASDGGGMINFSSSFPTLTNITFSGNTAVFKGGGLYNWDNSSPTVTNSTFSGNSAGFFGGGMYNEDNSSPTVTNSIIWNNSAGGSTSSVSASVGNMFGNPEYSFSLIAYSGGSGGAWVSAIGADNGNNIDTDPLFVDPPPIVLGTGGDLRLQAGSPAINAGINAANATTTDLAGNPRIVEDTIDIGAYEFQGEEEVFTQMLFPVQFSIFPNPVRNEIYIHSEVAHSEFRIFDLRGQTLILKRNANMFSTIDISFLSAGTYFITLTNNHRHQGTKVFVKVD
jgi:predicted outer membrane repeat protein